MSWKMFALLICFLTLHKVHSTKCNVPQDICTENTKVQADIVDIHNSFRRQVKPPASDMLKMSYYAEAAESAQNWVNKCILAHGKPSTRMINGYELGENLFYGSVPYQWKDVIEAWHSEVVNFQYPSVSINGQPTGHYTQVVWSSSYKIGCGVTLCPGNIYFYGCHYFRAGNFKNWIPYKLGEPCGSCENACEDSLCTNPCPHINKFINCDHLKAIFGCSNRLVNNWCPAACECNPEEEIIPIYKK